MDSKNAQVPMAVRGGVGIIGFTIIIAILAAMISTIPKSDPPKAPVYTERQLKNINYHENILNEYNVEIAKQRKVYYNLVWAKQTRGLTFLETWYASSLDKSIDKLSSEIFKEERSIEHWKAFTK